MPETTLPTASQVDAANNFMRAEVELPVLFQKLAELGIQPTTPSETRQLVELGAVLYDRAVQGLHKTAAQVQAETPNSFLDYAFQQLGVAAAPAVDDHQIKSAASQFVADRPEALQAAILAAYAANGGEVVPDLAPAA